MFAYGRDADDSIVLAAGIPVEWFEGDGEAIHGLRTPQGELGYSLRRDGDALVLEVAGGVDVPAGGLVRSEEHTSELQSLMRISYAVFCLKKKNSIRRHDKPQLTTQIHITHVSI